MFERLSASIKFKQTMTEEEFKEIAKDKRENQKRLLKALAKGLMAPVVPRKKIIRSGSFDRLQELYAHQYAITNQKQAQLAPEAHQDIKKSRHLRVKTPTADIQMKKTDLKAHTLQQFGSLFTGLHQITHPSRKKREQRSLTGLVARETRRCRNDFRKLSQLVSHTERMVDDELDDIKKQKAVLLEQYQQAMANSAKFE